MIWKEHQKQQQQKQRERELREKNNYKQTGSIRLVILHAQHKAERQKLERMNQIRPFVRLTIFMIGLTLGVLCSR